MVSYPDLRLRRVREHEPLRRMVRETTLSPSNFIYPMFVTHGQGLRQPIEPMPGCFHFSIDQLVLDVAEAAALGIPGVLLFGLPAEKDPMGTEGYDPEGIIQEAVRAIKKEVPGMMVITDVCMCEYTDHGHCGIVEGDEIRNDPSVERLAATALSHARAGADIVAPSDMMDGRVAAIRHSLDEHGFSEVPIVSYAAKFASAYYGPFRDAAESTPQFGDRRSYQLDPPNRREALREMRLDYEEGADVLMVKPALPYLDVLADARREFDVPLAAYHVSGEYAMIHAAAERGWIDGERAMEEAMIAIKRAGADWILTYAAADLAEKLG